MAKYVSGRQKNLKVGISSYSENLTSIEVIGNVGIATTNATSRLYVVGDGYFTGIVTASNFYIGGNLFSGGSSFTQITVSGISTLQSTTLIGGGTSTGTVGQVLQVTGINSSVYIGGNLGIGSINPTSKLTVVGDASISGLTTTNNLYVAGVGTFLSSGLKIRNPLNTFDYTITGGAIGADYTLTLPAVTANATLAQITQAQTFAGTQTFSGQITHSATTSNFNAQSYTTGTVTIGGPSQTGAIVLGQSTVSQTLNLSTGVSGVGTTKTINFGTGGATGSFTQINIGPTAGVGTVVINSGTNLGIGSTTPTSALTVQGDVRISGVVTASQFSTGSSGIEISTDTISGPAIMYIDPSPVGVGTTSGIVRIRGDLYVDGTQFVVNSSTIELADLRVGIATTVGTSLLLDGGGIGIGSANIVKTILWNHTAQALTSNADWNLESGKQYEIGGTPVLSSTQLTVTNINASGISTLGITSTTNLTSQQLNVSGISTLGITSTTNLTSQQLNVSGISTLGVTSTTNLTSQQLNVSGISTLGITSTTNLTSQQLNVSGITTLGITSATNLTSQQLNVSGISTLGVTSATNLTSQQLQVTGISTFTNGPVLIGTATSTGTASQRLQVDGGAAFYGTGSNVGIGTAAPLGSLQVGVGTSTFIVTGIGSVGIGTTNPQFKLDVNGDINFNGTFYQNGSQFVASRWDSGTGNNIYRLNGNVGVGTTNPTQSLDVNGAIRLRGALFDVNNQSGTLNQVLISTESGVDWVDAAPADAITGLTIKEENDTVGSPNSVSSINFISGNLTATASGVGATITLTDNPTFTGVGIGTTDPTTKLHVIGNVRVSGILTANRIFSDLYGEFVGGSISGTNIVGTSLSISGISTFTNGPVLIGTTTATGTASQRLQVDGGAYVSDFVGIGTTNPTSTLTVVGNGLFSGTGIVTATTFVGALTGTATTATTALGFSTTASINTTGIVTASQLVSNVAQGTAPITVGSSTLVTNLNANYLNGQLGSYYTDATNLTGTISSSRLTGSYGISITGTATTATNLSDAFNITTGIINSARLSGTYDINVSYANTAGIATIAQGLTGTPNITVGIVTATSYNGSGTNLTGIVTSIVAGSNITVSGSNGQVTINAAGDGFGKFDTAIDNVLYVQPTGTLDIVGVGTTTTQITTLPSGSTKYLVHSIHVTNISNGDAEITAGFVMDARKVPASISVSVGSSGGPGIHTFTVGSASSITVGMAVTGTGNIGETTGIGSTAGFQFNTYVTSVDGNRITLSKPMSGRATGVLYFSPVSKVSSRLPVPVGSAVELLKQPMILNALDSIVLQSTGAGSGIGSTSTLAISQTLNSNFLTVTAGAAITNFLSSGMLISPTGSNTGIQTNTFVGVGYTPGALSIPMTRPATSTLSSQSLSFTEVVVPQDGALQVTVVYQSSTDTAYQNGTGTVVGIVTLASQAVPGVTSTTPSVYYGTGNTYPSIIQSIRVSNISDSIIYPGGDYPVSVGIGNSDTIFSWLAYNMVIPRNSSIELCEAPKRIGIGQSIFATTNTPYAIEIQIAGKQKTT